MNPQPTAQRRAAVPVASGARSVLAIGTWALTGAFVCTGAGAVTPPRTAELIRGCQGEGCDCLYAYRKAPLQPGPTTYPIPTWRAIDLRATPELSSPVLAHFEPGLSARPLRQVIVVQDRGAYVVTGNPGKVKGLRMGDRLELLLNDGEGFNSALKGNTRISFDESQVTLQTVRPTLVHEWTEVQVGGQRGFTLGNPFQGCLE